MDLLFLENGVFEPNIQNFRLFDEVIRPVFAFFDLECKMKKIRLSLSTDLGDDRLVQIDRARTQQVLVNLLHNATKMSP